MSNITLFEIKKLHGYKDFNLHFKDSTLILVGENGLGKTTVLRLLYYLLSGQWSALAKFKFTELAVTIDNKRHVLSYSYLQNNLNGLNKKILMNLPQKIRHRFVELLEESEGNLLEPELEMLCDRYDIPMHYIFRELNLFQHSEGKHAEKLKEVLKNVKKSLNAQLLYLPTYRRIEQELNLIFKGLDDEELFHRRKLMTPRKNHGAYVELIEFGMKDVDRAIKSTLEQLKEFARESLNNLTLGYLGDVVDQKYSEVSVNQIQEASDETIENVLNRIHDTILSQSSKNHLSHTIQKVKNGETLDEHAKVICHYFIKLLGFQQELQEKENSISKFCDVCNEYMIDKQFIYDSPSFSFKIEAECPDGTDRKVELRQLSSGEKQIVSLFSHLYLSGGNDYFVLIDEPELSLSVPWQRRFLTDIKNGGFCSGLVAVTHSPFIYDNELKQYAHGLGEFCK
ncbi:MAG: AAA family ATPase [Desulfobacteraceae bacterium]